MNATNLTTTQAGTAALASRKRRPLWSTLRGQSGAVGTLLACLAALMSSPAVTHGGNFNFGGSSNRSLSGMSGSNSISRRIDGPTGGGPLSQNLNGGSTFRGQGAQSMLKPQKFDAPRMRSFNQQPRFKTLETPRMGNFSQNQNGGIVPKSRISTFPKNTGIGLGDIGMGRKSTIDTNQRIRTMPDLNNWGINGKLESNPMKRDRLGIGLQDIQRTPKNLGRTFDIKTGIAGGNKLDSKFGRLDGIKQGRFGSITQGTMAKKLDLSRQLELGRRGDVARQLDLGKKLQIGGGWKKRLCGPIGKDYSKNCFDGDYCGPKWCPDKCHFPKWGPWVKWCWIDTCHYDPCPWWVVHHYPIWRPLPHVCGTWVDVRPIVIDTGVDLQLLAVRFVDGGHSDQHLGPRYRVWLRNNSPITIRRPFNVLAMAASGIEPADDLPQAGVAIKDIGAGQTMSVDIRMPVEAASGDLTMLHVLVDSHRNLAETFEDNNGAVVPRGEILPVDPVVFKADSSIVAAGQVINVAGEGLGPEAGQVLLHVGGLELQGEIEGWFDLGVQVRLPSLPLANPTALQVIVVRGDGAAANPLELSLVGGRAAQAEQMAEPELTALQGLE